MRALIFLILSCSFTNAERVLLLFDNANLTKTYSEFIKFIEDRGNVVTTKSADSSDLALIKYGELLYEHLLILAPSVDEFGGSVSVAEIASFIDKGGNVLIAGGPNLGDAVRELAAEVGFEFSEEKSAVIDHFNYDANLDGGNHTTLVVPSSQLATAPLITGDGAKLGPILYRGIALIAEGVNPLRYSVLTASSTAYSFIPTAPVDEYPATVGKSTILIGAMQARNNARVVVCGSLDFFSNAFFNANVQKAGSTEKPIRSGNALLAEALGKWVLKESGVLRIKSVNHHIVGQSTPPAEYTIMDDVHYEILIEELKAGKWLPFQGDDVQLEFVRIDPFVRTTLKNKNGRLYADFKVPDVYGVFKFLVDYHRIGYTHVHDVHQVSVRPLKHTQYERFSRCAYPYYVSVFSMMIGVVIFSFFFLYYKEAQTTVAVSAATQLTGKAVSNVQKAKTS